MSEAIYTFQQTLFKLLSNNLELKGRAHTHHTVQRDAKMPYIFLDMQKAVAQDISGYQAYQIEFELALFIQEKQQKEAALITSIITKLVAAANFSLDKYQVIGTKNQQIIWERSKDLRTIKIAMPYKAFLRQL